MTYYPLNQNFHSPVSGNSKSVTPLSNNVKAPAGQEVDIKEDGGWRDLVVDLFHQQGAEYELRALLCTDLKIVPVEDAAIDWPQDESPYQALGKIVIPAQEAFSPARRIFADDVLSFNPFHCLPEHLPLGSINRARIKACETSTAYRHHMNAQPSPAPSRAASISYPISSAILTRKGC